MGNERTYSGEDRSPGRGYPSKRDLLWDGPLFSEKRGVLVLSAAIVTKMKHGIRGGVSKPSLPSPRNYQAPVILIGILCLEII